MISFINSRFSNAMNRRYLFNSSSIYSNLIYLMPVSWLHRSIIDLAGHSKWANIRHIKALKDGQRASAFTKYSRQIRMAIQEGGSSNPNMNSNLRNVIDQALKNNMPMGSIQSSIKKIEASKTQLKKHVLEIRALNKIFMVVLVYTENLPNFKMNLAPILKKSGAAYLDVKHLFDENGLIETKINDSLNSKSAKELEDICTENAIECGAEEVEILNKEQGLVNFLCNPIELNRISEELKNKGYSIENSEHMFVAKKSVKISEQDYNLYQQFIEKLRAVDGVEEIFDNLDLIS